MVEIGVGDVEICGLYVNTNGADHIHSTESDGESSWDTNKWDVDKRAV